MKTTNDYSFQSYIHSGKHEKRVWWWPHKWYVRPSAMEWKEWEAQEAYVKANYPVQHFFRETVCDFFEYRIKSQLVELKYGIKNRVINPRKEMRDKVFPHCWNDLTESIVIFHLEALIEFVDREKCFEIINYDSDKSHKEFANGLKECYDYAKTARPQWQKDLTAAYNLVPDNSTSSYHEQYKDVNEIEAKITEYDTKVCEWVIKNRSGFWC